MSSLFTINLMKTFSTKSYDLKFNKDCSICRNSLNGQSITAEEGGWTSAICVGECGHTFHSECIKPWLNNNQNCPNCGDKKFKDKYR